MCTCMLECLGLDFQIPVLLYEALALETTLHPLSNNPEETAFNVTNSVWCCMVLHRCQL